MSELSLGRYIFERLYQLSIRTVFGVPGDFNLTLLDKIYETEAVHGKELSALNGIAGSYAEHVGVVHIVGTPSNEAQNKKMILHHTLGNGDFTVFHRMSESICETTAFLNDIETACSEIDRAQLDQTIDLSLVPNDEAAQNEVIERVLAMIEKSERPSSWYFDEGGVGEDMSDPSVFSKLVIKLSTGNSIASRYGGVTLDRYLNRNQNAVESADLVLSCGALLSDFNTGSFSYSIATKNVVEFHSNHTKIRQAIYPGQDERSHTGVEFQGWFFGEHFTPQVVPKLKLVNTPASSGTPLTRIGSGLVLVHGSEKAMSL
ncbi:Pyruvate decarboxylase [Candida viswanathii]|uniref:Pyruvate decarboxylase n=1 Tax=Candida viswanathii TaxID=5486 RepID=A0A367Y0S4_9ASCO|nr:Pyruvate decarboxylase [Candida viswanathii]